MGIYAFIICGTMSLLCSMHSICWAGEAGEAFKLMPLYPSLVEMSEENRLQFISGSQYLELEAKRNENLISERRLPWVSMLITLVCISGFFISMRLGQKFLRQYNQFQEEKEHAFETLAALKNFRKQSDPMPSEWSTYYIQAVEAMRTYIDDKYQLRATGMTSQEFIREIRRISDFDALLIKNLQICADTADLIKYAKRQPKQADLETVHATVTSVMERNSESRSQK